jgi:hypothetical protein
MATFFGYRCRRSRSSLVAAQVEGGVMGRRRGRSVPLGRRRLRAPVQGAVWGIEMRRDMGRLSALAVFLSVGACTTGAQNGEVSPGLSPTDDGADTGSVGGDGLSTTGAATTTSGGDDAQPEPPPADETSGGDNGGDTTGAGGSDDATTTGATTGASGAESTGQAPADGACCEANGTPGCEEAAVQTCVCAQDSYCCDTAWDATCVQQVGDFGCGMCEGQGGTTGGGAGDGACCEANGTPGCEEQSVHDCVCAQDSYCCDTQWDAQCVEEVDTFGCGQCQPVSDPQACCEAGTEAGCPDAAVQQCVCDEDPYCCDTAWDDLCVQEVDDFGCATCQDQGGGDDENNNCCEPHQGRACEDAIWSVCTCLFDPYCCIIGWDATCVQHMQQFGCGFCL